MLIFKMFLVFTVTSPVLDEEQCSNNFNQQKQCCMSALLRDRNKVTFCTDV